MLLHESSPEKCRQWPGKLGQLTVLSAKRAGPALLWPSWGKEGDREGEREKKKEKEEEKEREEEEEGKEEKRGGGDGEGEGESAKS